MFTDIDYVSLETAKTLKVLGFNEPCSRFYCDSLNCIQDTYASRFRYVTYKELDEGDILIPTLYEAQMWLLEKHNLYLYPAPYLSKDSDEEVWFNIDIHYRDEVEWAYSSAIDGKFTTYQQALDYGLKKALESIVIRNGRNICK